MQETTNLDLELYEATDNANLLDGYNASMRKIDAHEGTQDGLITLAQNTANSASTAATNAATAAATADAKATDAATAAATADTKATSALANAAQALAQLGGMHLEHIHYEDENTLWTAGTWASRSCSVNALVLYDEDDNHGIMIAECFAQSNAATPATAWAPNYIATFRDWKTDTSEGHDAYGYFEIINNTWYNVGKHMRLDSQGRLYWEVFTGASSALPAGEAVTGVIVTAVTKRN